MNFIEEMIQKDSNYQKKYHLENKLVVITGASSGIGLASALILGKEKCKLRLIARRQDRLEELKSYLTQESPCIDVQIFAVNINNSEELKKLDDQKIFDCDVLINNAGLARERHHVADLTENEIDDVIDTNVKSMAKIARYCARYMQKNGTGHIVNIGSISSHYAYEGGSIYCASKFAVRAFTTSLRQEMHDKGVRVSLVSPGSVATEFSNVRFPNDPKRAEKVYADYDPLTAMDVGRTIKQILEAPQHVNLDEILIMPTDQAPMTLKVHRKYA